ncbi:MAG: TldD/PmbA family protein [Chloroflexi bacterium]|nr:TldD/PmbA family protein [Chloroflexota bacterium]MCI0578225.1 TldD/PmbA family protein [Chloroflexota bacterium]MCI0646608.1 TldD/PmbA family protein [Chloroflexota bacterium]MCI0730267.1 TldD/PmbA family protein [Chloroflexota bacterium]
MKELMLRAMDLAQLRGAQYADVRLVHNVTESLAVKNGVVSALKRDESLGLGVRVLANNAWGFAASQELTPAEVDRVTGLALQIAQASAMVPGEPVVLGPPVTSQGSYATPVQIDPFTIPVEEKLALLLAADEIMGRVAGITVRNGNLVAIREQKLFANSEGAFTDQTIYEMGGGIYTTAVGNGEVQQRSYPAAMGRQQVTAGWEAALAWDLPGNAERIAGEAVQLLTADPCPRDLYTTIILGGEQLALQVHESCGHPIELDRVFGTEAAFAGTSFLTTDKLHTFHYGSEVINLTADSVRPLGLGTFGWDDEGVPAQSTPIVKDGLFVGYLMSRETASRLGLVSNGCMRASGWNRIPLIRMTNVSLEPGSWRLEDLIAGTDEGIYMETNRSWSIDDRRYNFQFGTEIGYEIKNGQLGRMLRNCTYTGITPEFWNSCDAVCNQDHWVMWGTPNCGKGQPGQLAHTGHGAAPARFRNVHVGVV